MKLRLSPRERAYFVRKGKQGGQARASRLTPERRREIARQAAQARWKRVAPERRKALARQTVLARWRRHREGKRTE